MVKSNEERMFFVQVDDLRDLWLHTIKDGKIDRQGRVIKEEADRCLVQLYGWLIGLPTDQVWYDKAFIEKHCRLYATGNLMGTAFDKEEDNLIPEQVDMDGFDDFEELDDL